MSNYRKHIDQFFREKLGNYRETPPPDVWESLESRLDGLAPAKPGVPYRRWIWHAAIVSVIMFLGLSVGRKLAGTDSSSETAVNNMSQSNADNSNTGTSTGTIIQPDGTPAATTSNAALNSAATSEHIPATGTEQPAVAPAGSNGRQRANQGPATNGHKAGIAANNTHGKTPAKGKHTPPANTYNSQGRNAGNQTAGNNHTTSTRQPNPAPGDDEEETIQTNASPNTTLSVVSKPDPSPKAAQKPGTATATTPSAGNKAPKPGFPRLTAGVKPGFEGGVSNNAGFKVVIAPYLQYNLSPKFALMVQPAIKAGGSPKHDVGNPQQYYHINEGGRLTQATTAVTVLNGTVLDTVSYNTTYTYTESHDSIVKTNRTGGSYMEFEVPVLLHYNISKRLAVYGGVNMVYSQMTGITESTYTATDITRTQTTKINTVNMPTAADQPAMGFGYTGTPYAAYTGPAKAGNSSDMRAGYMIGFTYAFRSKWMVDGLMQQAPAKPNVVNGYDLNTPLSAPYFRLSIGYKLTK